MKSIWQNKAEQIYMERNYTKDPVTIALGICEEAGELGKSVNWFLNPLYIKSSESSCDSIEHEMKDLLVYIAALANVLNIDLDDLAK